MNKTTLAVVMILAGCLACFGCGVGPAEPGSSNGTTGPKGDDPTQCPPVMCEMYCEYGFEVDPTTGCEICSCAPAPEECPPVMCEMYCVYGFDVDPITGCEICVCAPAPTPSQECDAVARFAVQTLETENHGSGVTIEKTELVGGYSDYETIRVSFSRGGSADSYLVSAETMGGAPCYAYGLQLKSQEIDLQDNGARPITTSRPSISCQTASRALVQALEKENHGAGVQITKIQLLAAHSDRELIRLSFTNQNGESDSYLINAETMGGDPCLVYGLQLRSSQIDLRDTFL